MDRSKQHRRPIGNLERFADLVSRSVGTSAAFIIALFVIVAWGFSGPLFGFSDTWQLVINTGTTIVTFLMVFLIQRSQNKSMEAVILKLNELVAATEGASSRLLDVEDISEVELKVLHEHYRKLSEMARRDGTMQGAHSIEEAEIRHHKKRERLTKEQSQAAAGNRKPA